MDWRAKGWRSLAPRAVISTKASRITGLMVLGSMGITWSTEDLRISCSFATHAHKKHHGAVLRLAL
jgi:hypothetical protein